MSQIATQNVMEKQIGGIKLTAAGLECDESATWEDMEEAAHVIDLCHRASNWWIGDWLNFGEGRPEWGEGYQQAAEIFNLAPATLLSLKSIAKNVPHNVRQEQLDFKHHIVVAKLPPKDQKKWLKAAMPKDESAPPKLSPNELRRKIKSNGEAVLPDHNMVEQDIRYELTDAVNRCSVNAHKLREHLGESGGLAMICDTVDHLTGLWKGWLNER